MNDFLPLVVALLFLVIIFNVINQKFFKFSYEIALMLFATITGGVMLCLNNFVFNVSLFEIITDLHTLNIESFLMNGALCFMLFAGSCHMRVQDFKKDARSIGVYSLLATFVGSVFYGLVFYLFVEAFGLSLSILECLILGSIISPTDPIAATSILNRFGLPQRTGFLIEAESLLNDGVGVVAFVFFTGSYLADLSPNISMFDVLIHQLAGAIVIGAAVSFVCFNLLGKEDDFKQRIYISMLCVSLSYLLCQYFKCSGPIACVVCGVMFSDWRTRQSHEVQETFANFDICWEAIDNFLNSVLYVIMGLSVLFIMQMDAVVVICIATVVSNFFGRGGSVYVCSFFLKEIPDKFSRSGFTVLLTWGGLRGGLCIALAMSTKTVVPDDHFQYIMGATYAIVFFTTVVQGLSLKRVYNYLRR
ncbi:MAG: sodium:proton antiporter [Succinivibrio sp.]|nr:sodium:proton antiporter [Succinivibrio sp.]